MVSKAANPVRILGFDNWTGGKVHFERLFDAFAANGMNLDLVHLGSWGNDMGRPPEEWSGKLRIRDISYFGNASFPALLEAERPDAVLLFSTDTFAHRAFLRHCRARKIPAVYVYHGIIKAQKNEGGRLYKTSFMAQVKFALGRLPKALCHVWPSYMRALFETRASLADWSRFGGDIIRGGLGKTGVTSARDARTDRCGVYIEADVADAVTRYGFSREQVAVVGNPDLARFGLNSDLLGWALARQGQEPVDVMYIDTGLIFTGWVFASHQDFFDHMVETRDRLAAVGKRLVFKPHPDHVRAGMAQKLQAASIEICSSEDFVKRLKGCCAAIVETSTAALVPALMGLPLFLAKYGKLSSLNFGEVLTSYPRSHHLSDLTDLTDALTSENALLDESKTRAWIADNSGPLPAEDMPKRVVDIFRCLVATP